MLYVVIGLATIAIAKSVAGGARQFWRLAAWLLSLAVFAAQIAYARVREAKPPRNVAAEAAITVAVAVLVLALLGPVRSHWTAGDLRRSALMSVIVWPIATGIPAFFVAWICAALFGNRKGHLFASSRI